MIWHLVWARLGTTTKPVAAYRDRTEAEIHAAKVVNVDQVGVDEIYAEPKAKGKRR